MKLKEAVYTLQKENRVEQNRIELYESSSPHSLCPGITLRCERHLFSAQINLLGGQRDDRVTARARVGEVSVGLLRLAQKRPSETSWRRRRAKLGRTELPAHILTQHEQGTIRHLTDKHRTSRLTPDDGNNGSVRLQKITETSATSISLFI